MAERRFLKALETAGRLAEDALLVLLLSGMMLLAIGQIVLRNVFDVGFLWTDELLRLLVLWLAMAGAVAASRQDKHITISFFERFLSGRTLAGVRVVTDLFTAAICAVVFWHSLRFVMTTHEFGDVLLGGIPAWMLQAILPVGFGLIGYRYFLYAIANAVSLVRGRTRVS